MIWIWVKKMKMKNMMKMAIVITKNNYFFLFNKIVLNFQAKIDWT